MFKKVLILEVILLSSLFAKDCASYFNPDKFYEAPSYLEELIEDNIKSLNIPIFGKIQEYKNLNFKKEKNTYIKENSYVTFKEYVYPQKSQLWKYKIKDGLVDTFDISKKEYYKFDDSDIANEINENFEQFWNDWVEDGYSMQLIPTHTLFRYKEYYFALSIFVYGFKGDASALDNTIVNYHFKDYTNKVHIFIKCEES